MIHFTWKYGKENTFEENVDYSDYGSLSEEELLDTDYQIDKPSQYLFDIHLTKLLMNSVKRMEYNVNERNINLGYEKLHTFLSYSIGLLNEISNTFSDDVEYNDLCIRAFEIIDFFRNKWDGHLSISNRIDENYLLNQENSIFYEDIIAISKYFNELHRQQPYYLYEKMVEKISPLIQRRRILVKMIKYIHP